MMFCPVGVKLFHMDERMDRRDEARCCLSQFFEHAKNHMILNYFLKSGMSKVACIKLKTMNTVKDISKFRNAFVFRILPLSYPNLKHYCVCYHNLAHCLYMCKILSLVLHGQIVSHRSREYRSA
jgi:hypothetical protein